MSRDGWERFEPPLGGGDKMACDVARKKLHDASLFDGEPTMSRVEVLWLERLNRGQLPWGPFPGVIRVGLTY